MREDDGMFWDDCCAANQASSYDLFVFLYCALTALHFVLTRQTSHVTTRDTTTET